MAKLNSLWLLALVQLLANGQETRGQAEVALQGYYAGGNTEAVTASTGAAISFRNFFESAGRLDGRLEAYKDTRRFNSAENYVSLNGAPWLGYRWNLTGGDYRLSLRPEGLSPSNLYSPEIRLRGARVDVLTGKVTVSFFMGSLMAMRGPRMPYFYRSPQSAAGATAVWKPSEKLTAQSTLLSIRTDAARLARNPEFLIPGREFSTTTQWLSTLGWRPTTNLKIFGELGVSSVRMLDGRPAPSSEPVSSAASMEWDGARLQARLNYIRQGASYLPLAGYFLGDRKGPFADLRYRLTRRVSVFASASSYSSNIDHQPGLASMRSKSLNGGFSADLPSRISLVGTWSLIQLQSNTGDSSALQSSRNRMLMLSAMRTFRRVNLRVGWREMDLSAPGSTGRLRSLEVDQSYSFRRFMAGGGIRFDRTRNTVERSSLVYRASFQARFNRFSAQAFTEFGHDLLNRTLFVASQTRSTTISLSARIDRNWSVNAEIMHNTLTSEINPQNAFLLANNGVPMNVMMEGLNRWTVFFRLTRTVRWGKSMPAQMDPQRLEQMYPVLGSVEGFVRESGPQGPIPAAGIPVTLDGIRTEVTDQYGRYSFPDVAQGRHTVALPARELPAEFDPASAAEMSVLISPRRATRTDFEVKRLHSLPGKVVAPPGVSVSSIVLRLSGAARYTTPDEDGGFTFYNLPAGTYQLSVDPATIPEGYQLSTPKDLSLDVRAGEDPPVVLIGFKQIVVTKTIRQIDLSSR